MKVFYSPRAKVDLSEIYEYIAVNLQNPDAAESIVLKIVDSAGLLSNQPMLGFSVAEKTGRVTDIRCLLSGNYGIFYRVISDEILVIRIIDVRTDYMTYALDL